MLMHNSKGAAPIHRPGKADPDPMRDYPVLSLVMDAGFAVHAAIGRWFDRRRTRQILAALDDHQLRDIGLSRADVPSKSGQLVAVLAKRVDGARVSSTWLQVRREARQAGGGIHGHV